MSSKLYFLLSFDIMTLMNDNKETISNEISEYRKKKELTQEKLADEVQVTRQTIIAMEKGCDEEREQIPDFKDAEAFEEYQKRQREKLK